MNKEEKLQQFLTQKAQDSNVLSVIVFGSYARGNSRPGSDIDLIIIVREGFKRVAEVFEDQDFEITYTTEKDVLGYWQSHKDDAISLWNVAQILFDRDGTGARLQEFGKELLREKPPRLTADQLAHLRFDALDSFKAIEDIGDPAAASLLLNKKALDLLNVYFDQKQLWRPAPKQQLGALRQIDNQVAQLFEAFYLTSEHSQKVSILKEIATKTLV